MSAVLFAMFLVLLAAPITLCIFFITALIKGWGPAFDAIAEWHIFLLKQVERIFPDG